MKKRKSKTEWVYSGQRFRVGESYKVCQKTEEIFDNGFRYDIVVAFQRIYIVIRCSFWEKRPAMLVQDILTRKSFWMDSSRFNCIEKVL